MPIDIPAGALVVPGGIGPGGVSFEDLQYAIDTLKHELSQAAVALAHSEAAVMLHATGGTPVLTGVPPQLERVGNLVFMAYNGVRSATPTGNVANTVSIAAIPAGFQPVGNVAVATTAPSGTMSIQVYTTGTNVFPDNPGVNVTTGNARWTLRFSGNLAANVAISLSMFWQTMDQVP